MIADTEAFGQRPHRAIGPGTALRRVADDILGLMGRELALARSEANDKMRSLMASVLTMIVGAMLAQAALVILLIALVAALDEVMPDWAAALIVGGAVAIVGFLMVRGGEKSLADTDLAPHHTAESLRQDAQLVKDKLP